MVLGLLGLLYILNVSDLLRADPSKTRRATAVNSHFHGHLFIMARFRVVCTVAVGTAQRLVDPGARQLKEVSQDRWAGGQVDSKTCGQQDRWTARQVDSLLSCFPWTCLGLEAGCLLCSTASLDRLTGCLCFLCFDSLASFRCLLSSVLLLKILERRIDHRT